MSHNNEINTTFIEIVPGYYLAKCICGNIIGVFIETEESKNKRELGISDDMVFCFFMDYEEFMSVSN